MPLAPPSRRRKVNPLTVLGELVQTTAGKWITHPPARCPNGHPLGPHQALVGNEACLGDGWGAHHLDLPHMRGDTVRAPLNTHCTALDGPVTVRISIHPADSALTSSRRLPTL
jgi:hypothetical protein